MPFSVVDAVDRLVASLEEPRDPDGHWHPSAIFGCPRKAVYEARGTKPSDPVDQRSKRVFRVGHILHEFVQEAVSRQPDVAESFAEISILDEDHNIAGHGDHLVRYTTGTWEMLEYKSINSRAFSYGELPKPEHVNQLSTYMWCVREHGFAANRGTELSTVAGPLGDDLQRGRIVYISKDDLRIEEYPVIWTPSRTHEVEARIAALDQAMASGALPDRLPPTVDKKTRREKRAWQCGYCPFQTLCWEAPE